MVKTWQLSSYFSEKHGKINKRKSRPFDISILRVSAKTKTVTSMSIYYFLIIDVHETSKKVICTKQFENFREFNLQSFCNNKDLVLRKLCGIGSITGT